MKVDGYDKSVWPLEGGSFPKKRDRGLKLGLFLFRVDCHQRHIIILLGTVLIIHQSFKQLIAA